MRIFATTFLVLGLLAILTDVGLRRSDRTVPQPAGMSAEMDAWGHPTPRP
jgi:hypothetical protein